MLYLTNQYILDPLSILTPFMDRNIQQTQLSDKEQEEKAHKSEFVRGLVLSTIFDDYL